MTITLIGATGLVGSAVLAELATRGHAVVAVSRHAAGISLAPTVTPVGLDARDTDALAEKMTGSDAVISAYNAGWDNPNYRDDFFAASRSIVAAAKRAGVKRVLVVGGAGSLWMGGAQLVDGPQFPEAYREAAKAVRDYLDELKNEQELDWVFLSPPIEFSVAGPTERKGEYRIGGDEPVFGADGHSVISPADLALAIVDEIEKPAHHRQRFTVGY